MSKRLILAAAVVMGCGASAMAQTPLPLTNPGFETQDAFNSAQPLGWHNLSNPQQALYNKTGPARTGNRSVSLAPVPEVGGSAGGFRGWTTDSVNFFDPNFAFYDPFFDFAGGDVTVTGYYMVPAAEPLTSLLENVGIKLNVKFGNQDYAAQDIGVSVGNPDINIARLLLENSGTGHTNGQWVQYTVTWPRTDWLEQCLVNEAAGFFNLTESPPDHLKIVIGRFADFANGASSGGRIFWDDMDFSQAPAAAECVADYNNDGQLNLDDLSDFITDFYTVPSIPGGLQPNAPTYAETAIGFGQPCPDAGDAPSPYAVDAYRVNGYRVGYSGDGSNSCPGSPDQNFPSLDNLSEFITLYYTVFGTPTCSNG
jgi:hypothetical protein